MALHGIGYGMIIECIINMLRVVLMRQAMELFLVKKDMDAKIFQAVYGGFYLATCIAYCTWEASFPYEACNLAGMVCITCCYDGIWKKRVWVALTVFCIDVSCLLAAIFSVGGNVPGNVSGVGVYLETAAGVLLFFISVTAISHILGTYACGQAVFMSGKKLDKGFAKGFDRAFDEKQAFLLSVTPTASILALCSMLGIKPEGDKHAAVVCACMLIINLSVFYLYHKMRESYMQLREQELYKQQALLYQNQMEILMESGSRIRRLRHDMKNHILALQAAARAGSREEMQVYLQKMQEFMLNPDEAVTTGNEDIDSLLNFKIRKAKERLKAVEVKISIPEKLSLHSFDLNVILGNLLDNALEAAAWTQEKELKLQMYAERGVLFLHIGNSFDDGRLSGEEGKRHYGIGLKNVRAAVDKYHGDMDILCANGWFEVDIMLYMKGL